MLASDKVVESWWPSLHVGTEPTRHGIVNTNTTLS